MRDGSGLELGRFTVFSEWDPGRDTTVEALSAKHAAEVFVLKFINTMGTDDHDGELLRVFAGHIDPAWASRAAEDGWYEVEVRMAWTASASASKSV